MTVLIVSALRNEAPYVLDWLAHHIAIGADRFLLYTNDCDDGTDDMLDLLAKAGVVEHRRHAPAAGESVQWHAFRDAWKSDARKAADWALVCDVDEYVNIHIGGRGFADLIGAVEADAMALPWRLFGSGGRASAEDRPVTERFIHAASDKAAYPLATRFFKTLFRTNGPFNQFGVHRPSQKKGAAPVWVDGAGAALPHGFASGAPIALPPGPGRSVVELNHYSLRSVEEFIVKAHRGLPNHRDRAVDLAYWVERNFNTVENRSIAAVASEAARVKERLLAIPGVAAQHARGIAWRTEAFAQLMRDETFYALYTRVRLAGDTEELSSEEAARLYARYQRLAR